MKLILFNTHLRNKGLKGGNERKLKSIFDEVRKTERAEKTANVILGVGGDLSDKEVSIRSLR